MQIVKRTMGWIQKPSAWEYQQSLNARRKAQAQNALATSIFSAKDTFNHDLTALILQSVVQRISKEAEARAKEALPDELLKSLSDKLDKTV